LTSGTYGNVELNNAAGATLPAVAPAGLQTIYGRLTITAGKITLPDGVTHVASFLTYGGADKAAGDYTPTSPTGAPFLGGTAGTGKLTVLAKPTSAIVANVNAADNSIIYGASSITVTGKVTSAGISADYGIRTRNEKVTVWVTNTFAADSSFTNTVNLADNGTFSLTLATGTLPWSQATPFPVTAAYAGGIDIAASQADPAFNLTVNQRPITITPDTLSKIYGQNDPTAFTWKITTGTLVNGEQVTGALSREVGDHVKTPAYLILQNTLALTNNYKLTLAGPVYFTINPKTITIFPTVGQSKLYGDLDPASGLAYTLSPALIDGDTIPAGQKLARDGGETVKSGGYEIKKGDIGSGMTDYTFVLDSTKVYFTINRLPITITFKGGTKVYGEADPATITDVLSINPSLKFTDTTSGKPSRASGNNVGDYPVGTSYTGSDFKVIGDTNYVISYGNAKLTITKRPVKVFAASPNPTYGDAIPDASLVSYQAKQDSPPEGLILPPGQNGVPGQTGIGTLPKFIAVSPTTMPKQGDLPGTYTFKLDTANPGSDPNYTPVADTANGTVTIGKKELTVTADDKKATYPATPPTFTVSYSGFYGTDDQNNSLTGTLAFSGNAVGATKPGVYGITPSGYASTKYKFKYVSGWLTISDNPGTTTITGDFNWDSATNFAWMINNANYGTKGANPGWSWLKVTGTLYVKPGFRVDLVTLTGKDCGRAAKFDPTRPYTWEIARADGGLNIQGGDLAANVTLNYTGANLFANPRFGGTFGISVSPTDSKAIVLNYAPPASYTVQLRKDLIADMGGSDIDGLVLDTAGVTTITPQDTLLVNLVVTNLQQNIVGSDVYINFDSKKFNALTGVQGAPQIIQGGGVWDYPIYTMWNVGGDLDTVLAIKLGAVANKDAGTFVSVRLTPTKTATGKSRIVFRSDLGQNVAGNGNAVTDILPVTGNAILPGRVMTDEITIVDDSAGPSVTAFTAKQTRPYVGLVDVANGDFAHDTQVVRTSDGAAASGPLVITITAQDKPGVGMTNAPTVTLVNGESSHVMDCTSADFGAGTFVYQWNVPTSAANGTWKATVVAQDTIIPPNKTTKTDWFTVNINTKEVTGVVEIDSFRGTNRLVTFKAGATGTTPKPWGVTLGFTSGEFLPAGSFQDKAAMGTAVSTTPDALSVYLRYGWIKDLPALANNLYYMNGGVATHIHKMLYGEITSLKPIADALAKPVRSVDVFLYGELSQATKAALTAYELDQNNATKAALLTALLLNDFNTVVLGPCIYEPVRFESVSLSPSLKAAAEAELANPSEPGSAGLVDLNRQLMVAVYPTYVAGKMPAQIAQSLGNYAGGEDPVLENYLLQGFELLTVDDTLWPIPHSTQFGPCFYNESTFLGVALSADTLKGLNDPNTFLDPLKVQELNQLLLQDAFPGQFQRAPLTPTTVDAAASPFGTTFESGMVKDLNVIVNGSVSLYREDPARFAGLEDQIAANAELSALLAAPPSNLVRENRLLLETAYLGISKNVLAAYRLVAVPDVASMKVSAKTAWNLQETLPVAWTGNDGVANFVNDGVLGWDKTVPSPDHYLRGGDINNDNSINLFDYNVLRTAWPTGDLGADVDGDGVLTSIYDYSLIKINWGQKGDDDVNK